jgi:hypothetical protein
MSLSVSGILIALTLSGLIHFGGFTPGSIPFNSPVKRETVSVNKISVRESTTELQITVGDALFVFGKSKGTLEKVKIGMNVLLFSQAPLADLNQSTFGKVAWKKLKDGSIQIQSTYSPWPSSLTWTVLADGRLKMEAHAGSNSYASGEWLGLGFNIPDLMLNQVRWSSGSAGDQRNTGVWKNSRFTELADPTLELTPETDAFFQAVKEVNLDFEKVSVTVQSESPSVFFGLGRLTRPNPDYPSIPSDLAFLVPVQALAPALSNQVPSGPSAEEPSISQNPLVLWFHFK